MERIVNYVDQLNILAETDNARAQCLLGKMYFLGKGVEQNFERAFELFSKATYGGDSDARYNLAMCCYYGLGTTQDYERAFFWLNSLTELKDVNVYRLLGVCHKKGYGVEASMAKAMEYFQKAADMGDTNSMCSIAYAYTKTIPPKLRQAFEYYERAAFLGCDKAQYNLATFYLKGIYVSKNPSKAYEWFDISAHNGNAQSQGVMGAYYLEPKHQNYKLAISWLEKAAEQGDDKALYNLGNCYFFGKGKQVDMDKAYQLYKKSAEKGNILAMSRVAAMKKP